VIEEYINNFYVSFFIYVLSIAAIDFVNANEEYKLRMLSY